jgi:hypothetical protein
LGPKGFHSGRDKSGLEGMTQTLIMIGASEGALPGANIIILNWQRPVWKGDQEVTKRSGRDEPVWVAIHSA